MENMDRKVIMNREEEAMSSCGGSGRENNCGKIDINCNNVNIYVSC